MNDALKTPGPTAAREVTNLTWLTDQMHASVSELEGAWYSFKFGPRPEDSGLTPGNPAVQRERFEEMSDLIPVIRQIAREIKERS